MVLPLSGQTHAFLIYDLNIRKMLFFNNPRITQIYMNFHEDAALLHLRGDSCNSWLARSLSAAKRKTNSSNY